MGIRFRDFRRACRYSGAFGYGRRAGNLGGRSRLDASGYLIASALIATLAWGYVAPENGPPAARNHEAPQRGVIRQFDVFPWFEAGGPVGYFENITVADGRMNMSVPEGVVVSILSFSGASGGGFSADLVVGGRTLTRDHDGHQVQEAVLKHPITLRAGDKISVVGGKQSYLRLTARYQATPGSVYYQEY